MLQESQLRIFYKLFIMEILKSFPKGSKIVSLIFLPKDLPCTRRPGVADYKNPLIRKIIPCLKKKGNYYDLRDGKQIFKNEDTLEWPVYTGIVFTYPKNYNLLISRRITDQALLSVRIDSSEFRPETMVKYKL